MLVLDTDHLSQLGRSSAAVDALVSRLAATGGGVATTIATVEELVRGRLSQIARAVDQNRLVAGYARFQEAVEDLREWEILPFDQAAASEFDRLRALRLGIATMDLRIASIALANDATLLSRNMRDFTRVPELKVEDWLT